MNKQFDRRTRLTIKILLLLVAAGAWAFIWREVNLAADTTNLLTNPGFEDNGLSGWQAQTMGEAETAIITATNHPDDSYLALEIPNAEAGGLAGVGQRLTIAPLERYRLTTEYELIDPEQSSAELVVRVSQFDRNGELVKTDEFSDPNPLTRVLADDTGQLVWQSPVYHIVTHWRAATVEIGLGLFGQQAATVAIDDVRLQRQPTWLSRIIHDPVALSASALVVVILGYVVGWPAGRRVYNYVDDHQARAEQTTSIWRELGWVGLLYTGLTLLLTYPVGWHIDTAVAGAENWDALQYVWSHWWIKKAVLDLGVWPDDVAVLYYPLVVKNTVLGLKSYVQFLALPFTLIIGPIFAYNLSLLLSFVLSGLAGYLLCRYLCRYAGAALIGGLIFAFYPNRFGHAVAGHLTIITNYFLPLYALSLLVLLKRPSAKTIIWHGVCTMMLAWSNPMHIGYGIIPLLIFIGGCEIWSHFKFRQTSWDLLKQTFVPLILANLLAVILYLPFAWSTISYGDKYLEASGMYLHSLDLVSFIIPSPYHPILDKLDLAPPKQLWGIGQPRDLGEPLGYLGLTAVGLMVIAVWRKWKVARWWLGLVLVTALLSMGPVLMIAGQIQNLTLPYYWLDNLPFLGWSRTVGRLNETTMLGVAVLAAVGLDSLIGLKNLRAATQVLVRVAIVGVMVGLISIEYVTISPFPTETIPVSDYYHSLANEPIEGGLLELPPRAISNYAMYYQTLHETPLAGGYIHRAPPGTAELRRFYDQFFWPWSQQTVFEPLDEADIRAILADMNVKQIIAQRAHMNDNSDKAILQYLPVLFGAPIFEDSQILVYAVPPESGAMLPAWQLMPDQKNWTVAQDGAALRMEENGNLYIYAAQAGTVTLEFQLTDSFSSVGINLRLNDRPIEPAEHDRASGRRRFGLPLQAGFNYIRLNTQPAQEIEVERMTVVDSNL